MIWDNLTNSLIPRNFITARELQQNRIIFPQVMRFLETVGIVALALAVVWIMLWKVISTKSVWDRGAYLAEVQVLSWTFHFAANIRFMVAGNRAIVPVNTLVQSDLIRITPITNISLLIGIWWVAMHRVRGWMLALGIVQIGLVVCGAFDLLTTVSFQMTCLNPCVLSINGLYRPFWFTSIRSLPIVLTVISVPIFEMMACAALGIMSGLLAGGNGIFLAIILRFIPVLIFAWVPQYPWVSNSFFWRFAEYTWFSFADGGTGAMLLFAQIGTVGGPELNFQRALLAAVSILSMLLAYTLSSIYGTWLLMHVRSTK